MKPFLFIALLIVGQQGGGTQITPGGAGGPNGVSAPVPVGTIYGSVLQPDGSPVPEVSVELVKSIDWMEQRFLFPTGEPTKTDARGGYRFDVVPGEYYVRTLASAVDPHARTYFPDTAEPGNAAAIRVSQGANVSADIRLSQIPVFKILGRIADLIPDAGDHQLAGFYLTNRSIAVRDDVPPPCGIIRPCTSRQYPHSNAFVTFSKDKFEIRGVRPGSYDLFATMVVGRWTPGEIREIVPRDRPVVRSDGLNEVRINLHPEPDPLPVAYTTRTPVEVTTRDVDGISVVIQRGVDVTGRVLSTGKPFSMNKVSVVLYEWDNSLTEIWFAQQWSIEADKAGPFTLRNVPEGRYRLSLRWLPPDAYVMDVRQGGRSIYDAPVIVSRSAEPLEVLVDPAGGVIEGRVQNGGNAGIVLLPARRNSFTPSGIVARATQSGDFKLRGLAPGDYRIYAISDISAINGSADAKVAVPVTVKSGVAVTVRLSLIDR